jgi:hypothetical protein
MDEIYQINATHGAWCSSDKSVSVTAISNIFSSCDPIVIGIRRYLYNFAWCNYDIGSISSAYLDPEIRYPVAMNQTRLYNHFVCQYSDQPTNSENSDQPTNSENSDSDSLSNSGL